MSEAAKLRKALKAADDRSAALALLLARLTDETFDWAFSLCGVREGLDDLRAECKEAIYLQLDNGPPAARKLQSLAAKLEREEIIW